MIKIENLETWGFDHAMRGMRNPMNSWAKNDTKIHMFEKSFDKTIPYSPSIGPNDLDLAKRLAVAGTEHRKYARQIFISMDITAPLYWFKEFDTYKVGTTANSTSTMHKLCSRPLTIDDFSRDGTNLTTDILKRWIDSLNSLIECYVETKDKDVWRTIIQLLPSSYNQKRTITMNYENAFNMYHQRQNHKLSEWREFCEVLETLPYFKELISE